ncbi:MAG: hypothetical protein JO101_00230 [Candidatus Eremiobacteraeota bacterium]|nr:hypothetical protein [Candidatus Eremiobacteraeota bacterium]
MSRPDAVALEMENDENAAKAARATTRITGLCLERQAAAIRESNSGRIDSNDVLVADGFADGDDAASSAIIDQR